MKKGNGTSKKTPKYIISLNHFDSRMLEGMNELEALGLYNETCLHSTVSTLSNQHGITFKRKLEPHKHRNGGKTYFMRYWLISRKKAIALARLHTIRSTK
jgi:hypothetical protein